MERTRPGKSGDDWQKSFLEALAQMPNVRAAAEAAGVDHATVYRHRKKNRCFRERWDDAIEQGCDRIEQALFERAVHGVKKTIFFRDQPIAEEITYDTTAAIFLLKGHRPEKYRERQDVTTDGSALQVRFYLPERDTLPDGDDPAPEGEAGAVPP